MAGLVKCTGRLTPHRYKVWNSRAVIHKRPNSTGNLSASVVNTPLDTVRPWEEVPGPKGIPGLGTIFKYLPGGEYCTVDRTDADWKKFQKYGEIVKEEVLKGEVQVHLFHPDDIEHVYRMEGKYPFRGEFNALAKYKRDRGLPLELGSKRDEEWAETRRPVSQVVLKPKVVASYIPEQDLVARDFIKLIVAKRDNSGNLEILPELYKFTMEVASPVLYNRRFGLMKPQLDPLAAEIFKSVNDIFEGIYQCMFYWPLHKNGKTKTWKRFEKGLDFMYELGSKYIAENLSSGTKKGDKQSLVNNLLLAGAREDEAVDIVNSLFQGAGDSTGNTACFLLYNLAKHQHKQEKLYQLIKKVFPSKNSPITEEGLKQIQYIKACIRESMRVTPTTTGNFRILPQDIVIRNYRIPAGAKIELNNAVVGRREEFFKSPDKFIPERWVRGEGEKIHPFAAVPFSYGPRMCPGTRFAEQEVALAVIRVLQNFRVEYHGQPMIIKSKLLNVPSSPLIMKFIDRD